MSDGAGFSWFSADDARDLADIDSVELSDDMVDTMVERLNGCAHQFIFIAWQLQQRQTHTEVKSKLGSITSAVQTLQQKLDSDVLGLIAIGLQYAIEEESRTEQTEPRPVTAYAQDQAVEAAHDLTLNARRVIQLLAQGIHEAQRINNGRIERTKREKTQHKPDEALDELLWNLLDVRKSCLGKPAEFVDNPEADVPAELLEFLRHGLQVIRARVGNPADQRAVRNTRKLRALLNILLPALRERVRRLPERMRARQQAAADRAERADRPHKSA